MTGWQRAYKWLRYWNNLMLIPMFTVIVLESGQDGIQAYDFQVANLLFCVFFAVEWAIGLMVADDRKAYLADIEHGFELLSSIPFGYFFQSLRIFRFVRIARLIRIVLRTRRFRRQGRRAIRVLLIITAFIVAGGTGFRIVEPETVPTMGDAMWWAIVTMSTVGYGDIVPQTDVGRIVAGFLMLFGVGTFGYIAGIASQVFDDEEDEILASLKLVHERLDQMNERLG